MLEVVKADRKLNSMVTFDDERGIYTVQCACHNVYHAECSGLYLSSVRYVKL